MAALVREASVSDEQDCVDAAVHFAVVLGAGSQCGVVGGWGGVGIYGYLGVSAPDHFAACCYHA